MLAIFSIVYFLFWIAFYAIEGTHDAHVILWQQTSVDKNLPADKKTLAQKYDKAWHTDSAFEKAITHLALTIPIFFIGGGIYLFVALLLLSLSVRLLVHNYFINKMMGIDVNHIGTLDWFDIFLAGLQNKGISQWFIKFSLLIISIVLVIVFLLI